MVTLEHRLGVCLCPFDAPELFLGGDKHGGTRMDCANSLIFH